MPQRRPVFRFLNKSYTGQCDCRDWLRRIKVTWERLHTSQNTLLMPNKKETHGSLCVKHMDLCAWTPKSTTQYNGQRGRKEKLIDLDNKSTHSNTEVTSQKVITGNFHNWWPKSSASKGMEKQQHSLTAEGMWIGESFPKTCILSKSWMCTRPAMQHFHTETNELTCPPEQMFRNIHGTISNSSLTNG